MGYDNYFVTVQATLSFKILANNEYEAKEKIFRILEVEYPGIDVICAKAQKEGE